MPKTYEIEKPVALSGNAHSSCASLKRPDLGGVYPANGSQSQGIYDNQEVAESNDCMSRCPSNFEGYIWVAIHSSRDDFAGGK